MGMMDKIGGVLFGKSGMERNENLDAAQVGARNRQIAALGGAVDNAGSALGGYTKEGFNAYDEADGAGQFDRMKQFLTNDAYRQANQLSGSNMSRFGSGMRAGLTGIRDAYNKNMLGADQARLQAQTAGRQNAYTNQMESIRQALGGNAQMLGNTGQLQATQSTGLLDILGGASQGMSAISNIVGSAGKIGSAGATGGKV